MPNYFYLDANGQKQGPVNDQQLQALAARGIIVPTTPMVTDGGHKGVAGQIRGLFNNAPPQSPAPTHQQMPPSATDVPMAGSKVSPWAIVAGVLCLLLVGVVAGSMMFSTSSTPNGQTATDAPRPPAVSNQFTAAEQLEIDRFLGEYGNDIRAVRRVGNTEEITMLHNAAQYGTLAVVKYLVSQGLSVHVRDSGRGTPLHYAVNGANIEIADFLISQGADVNAIGSGRSPLHYAVNGVNVKMVEFLLSKGANARGIYVNRIVSGSTSLDEREKILELLFAHGARADADALHVLFANSTTIRPSFIRILVSNGADVNARNNVENSSPLFFAVRSQNVEAIRILLANGADIHARARPTDPMRMVSQNLPATVRGYAIGQALVDRQVGTPNERAKSEAVLAAILGQ